MVAAAKAFSAGASHNLKTFGDLFLFIVFPVGHKYEELESQLESMKTVADLLEGDVF